MARRDDNCTNATTHAITTAAITDASNDTAITLNTPPTILSAVRDQVERYYVKETRGLHFLGVYAPTVILLNWAMKWNYPRPLKSLLVVAFSSPLLIETCHLVEAGVERVVPEASWIRDDSILQGATLGLHAVDTSIKNTTHLARVRAITGVVLAAGAAARFHITRNETRASKERD